VPRDGIVDAETVARMVESGQIAVPTLTMMEAVVSQLGPPGDDYAYSRDSVAALHTAGVPILAGTDAASVPMLPHPVRHGESLHNELALLVDAGLTAVEALRSATVLPARYFDLDDRGAVAPGLRADLVLVEGNPLVDITATRRIRHVWCAGVEHALG
jgi:imidazolonepropionase-like amidohydrolase